MVDDRDRDGLNTDDRFWVLGCAEGLGYQLVGRPGATSPGQVPSWIPRAAAEIGPSVHMSENITLNFFLIFVMFICFLFCFRGVLESEYAKTKAAPAFRPPQRYIPYIHMSSSVRCLVLPEWGYLLYHQD